MSTTLYLHCVSHDPPIKSFEVGHNLSDLPDVREALRHRQKIVAELNELGEAKWDIAPNNGRKRNLWFFLYAHPNCNIGIWDEYGHHHQARETEKPRDPYWDDNAVWNRR